MAKEYIEREAVIRAINDYFRVRTEDVRAIPAADVVEVVRCRDCKFVTEGTVKGYAQCCLIDMTVRCDGFCSFGERRTDE